MGAYKRVLLKLSGEMFGTSGNALSSDILQSICAEVKGLVDEGVQVAIVVGGGNIFRGLSGHKKINIHRAPSDHMGMLATMINGIALNEVLNHSGITAHLQNAWNIDAFGERIDAQKAVRELGAGHVVIFVGGTGCPYFSTDTAAALRACEIGANVILKATKVDGVYDKDPHQHADAKKYERVTFAEAMERRLQVMDAAAFAMCRDNAINVVVFKFECDGVLLRAARGENVGTVVY